jgi:RimJ/RimL family protein N-acetyltransferase
MIDRTTSALDADLDSWPQIDPDGLPIRFTSREIRPRRDEYSPVLEGPSVRLEPLGEEHLDQLCEIGLDPELTRFMPFRILSREQMSNYIHDAIAARDSLSAIPFVIRLKNGAQSAQAVGSTRFMNIDPNNRRMEIGSTWIGKEWQRTGVNTEAKYVMLRHAFETLECIRVEFKTDSLNERSRKALLRIGAKQEGIFRDHVITSDGRIRHSVYFSVTSRDWPSVKVRLEGFPGYGGAAYSGD